MNLSENYAKCNCGQELKRGNRCAVVMQVPPSFLSNKRVKEEGYIYHGVIYCCKTCYLKFVTPIKEETKGMSFFHYPNHYKMYK